MTTVQHLLDSKRDYLITVGPEQTVQDALELMAAHRISSLPVTEGERLLGIVSERDYVWKAVPRRLAPWDLNVCEIMTEEVVCVTRGDSIEHCMDLMSGRSFRHLPVVEDGKLLGIVSITDVVRALCAFRVQHGSAAARRGLPHRLRFPSPSHRH